MALHSEHVERESLGGGRYRDAIHMKPIGYRVAGSLRRMTNLLTATGDPSFPMGVDELCQFRVRPKIAGNAPLIHFGKGQSHVKIGLVGANNNINVVVKDGARIFPNAWNNADLVYRFGGHRLQEDILLRANHPRSFAFRLQEHAGFDPVTLQFGNDFRILQPVLEPPAGSLELAKPLTWLVTQQGGKYILTVNLPDDGKDYAGSTLDPTFVTQPNAADGIDTRIMKQVPTTNDGASIWLAMGRFDNDYNVQHSIIKFDVSSIPGSTTITSAVFSVRIADVTCSYAGTLIDCYEIAVGNAAWIEGTKTNAQAGAGEPCWNALAANGSGGVTTAWAGSAGLSTAGTDYVNSVIGTLTVPNPVVLDGVFSTPLTPSVVGGWRTTNYGMLMRARTEAGSNQGAHVRSSDHATAAFRPLLTVIYTLPVTGRRALLGVGQ